MLTKTKIARANIAGSISSGRRVGLAVLGALALLGHPAAAAPEPHAFLGFQLQRFEPAPSGGWFFAVPDPWYSSARRFAADLTLDFGHNPLVLRDADGEHPVVTGQLAGHAGAAVSFFDRLTLHVSVPVTFKEWGSARDGAAPIEGATIADPRLGALVRLAGHADRDPASLSLSLDAWIPIGVQGRHAGDAEVRLAPGLVLGGMTEHVRWSIAGSFLFRHQARIGDVRPLYENVVGNELRLGAALHYHDRADTLSVGPEALLSLGGVEMQIGRIDCMPHAFERGSTRLEVLGSLNYLVGGRVMVGAAVGGGLLRDAVTPDFRAMIRIAWAPRSAAIRTRPACEDGGCPGIAGRPRLFVDTEVVARPVVTVDPVVVTRPVFTVDPTVVTRPVFTVDPTVVTRPTATADVPGPRPAADTVTKRTTRRRATTRVASPCAPARPACAADKVVVEVNVPACRRDAAPAALACAEPPAPAAKALASTPAPTTEHQARKPTPSQSGREPLPLGRMR